MWFSHETPKKLFCTWLVMRKRLSTGDHIIWSIWWIGTWAPMQSVFSVMILKKQGISCFLVAALPCLCGENWRRRFRDAILYVLECVGDQHIQEIEEQNIYISQTISFPVRAIHAIWRERMLVAMVRHQLPKESCFDVLTKKFRPGTIKDNQYVEGFKHGYKP